MNEGEKRLTIANRIDGSYDHSHMSYVSVRA